MLNRELGTGVLDLMEAVTDSAAFHSVYLPCLHNRSHHRYTRSAHLSALRNEPILTPKSESFIAYVFERRKGGETALPMAYAAESCAGKVRVQHRHSCFQKGCELTDGSSVGIVELKL